MDKPLQSIEKGSSASVMLAKRFRVVYNEVYEL